MILMTRILLLKNKNKKNKKKNHRKKPQQNRNMHEKVSPFVSKTLSKITTIIYISTKIFWILKNSCNDKRGYLF